MHFCLSLTLSVDLSAIVVDPLRAMLEDVSSEPADWAVVAPLRKASHLPDDHKSSSVFFLAFSVVVLDGTGAVLGKGSAAVRFRLATSGIGSASLRDLAGRLMSKLVSDFLDFCNSVIKNEALRQ